MADKKVTALTSLTAPTSADLLMIIDNPSGTPVSKQITLKNLAGGMPNTAVSTLSVSANTTLAGSNTVVSSNVYICSRTSHCCKLYYSWKINRYCIKQCDD